VNITKWVGVAVFLAGVVIVGAYSMYPLFNPDVGESTIMSRIRVGMVAMAIGSAILIITIGFERYKEWKKMKEEITEEDLRP
jgi:anaerobic C4-dicarboxylate transporter